MIQTIEELKKERPDLVELFENMNREQLLNQIYLEVIDLTNMEERVQVFMNECTDGFSKTNYTINTIKQLINQKKEKDLEEAIEDNQNK